jgi:hypothetical protein
MEEIVHYAPYVVTMIFLVYLETAVCIYSLYTHNLVVLIPLIAFTWVPWPHWVRLSISAYFCGVYKTVLTSAFEPPNQRLVIYAGHPHSIFPTQCVHYLANHIPCAVDPIVLYNLLARMCGLVSARRKAFIDILLSRGRILLFPGGADEVFLHHTNQSHTIDLYLHTGMFRVAEDHGAIIVPSLCLDDVYRYRTNRHTNKIGQWLWKWIHVGMNMHVGMYGIPYIPSVSDHLQTTIMQSPKGIDALQFTSVETMITAYKTELQTMASTSGIQINWHGPDEIQSLDRVAA